MKKIINKIATIGLVTSVAACGSAKTSSKITKIGSSVVIDFKGFLGDKQFAGGTGNDYTLKLGSGAFIPGFEDQLVGYKEGDVVTVKVTFPANYPVKDLAGKEVTFITTIDKVL